MAENNDLEKVKSLIKCHTDFPKKGILFRDLHPVMADHEAREIVVKHLVDRYKDKKINVIVGLESRGYYFGILLASALHIPFVPFRKAGKLPGEVIGFEYGLEYGKDKMEVQKSTIKKGDRIIIVDDLLATGGTANAACNLAQQCGGEIVEVSFMIELLELKGRSKAPKDVAYYSMFTY